MTNQALVECVPNFSEGRDVGVINEIAAAISSVEGISLLNIDPGVSTNRTVYTFVGHPSDVIEAAYQAIKKASELIDMTTHKGEHPRMGACDVCPLIPLSGIAVDELIEYANTLAKRVGETLEIPVYLYEKAATKHDRHNLATIRKGEYEGLAKKIRTKDWVPDYGPAFLNPRSGATAIGVRDFLVAFNVNLNTRSIRRANSIAFDVREKGRVKRKDNLVTGKIMRDEHGNAIREPGICKGVKAIAWYIEEYGVAQISMNLTDLEKTPLHIAFEACVESAYKRGLRVTGSELIGLVPKKVLLDAGIYFLNKQRRSSGLPDEQIMQIAIKSLGLSELKPFDPKERVIEYLIERSSGSSFSDYSINTFLQIVSSENPTPGGGSVSALVGALGLSLATMVANLSANKREWDDRWKEFSEWAVKSQAYVNKLLALIAEDSNAYDQIIAAIRLPKNTAEDKKKRHTAIQLATVHAIEVPLRIMEESFNGMEVILQMARIGNPNSISDSGVAALCAEAAVTGAFFNVKINTKDLEDRKVAKNYVNRAESIYNSARNKKTEILQVVSAILEDSR